MQLDSQGYAHGPVCLFWRGEPDSSTHERVNPGGTSGLLLGTRESLQVVQPPLALKQSAH